MNFSLWKKGIKKLTFTNMLLFLGLMSFTTMAVADDVDYNCVLELDEIMAEYNLSNQDPEFCSGLFEGVAFKVASFQVRDDGRYLQGGATRLLSLRHPFAGEDDVSQLSLMLVPRTTEIWDVKFLDASRPDEILDGDGGTTYVVWGLNQLQRNLHHSGQQIDDTSLRVFICRFELGVGCHTFYEPDHCSSFRYPRLEERSVSFLVERPTRPIFSIAAGSEAASLEMFRNFEAIDLLLRAASDRIRLITCFG